MAAIDELNATLATFGTGLADAKAALVEKNVDVSDLTIINLGEKIRSIQSGSVTTYDFSIKPNELYFDAMSGILNPQTITVISTKTEDGVTTNVPWYFTGEHKDFSIEGDVTYNILTVAPLSTNPSTSERVFVITVIQYLTGESINVLVRQEGSSGGGSIEI